VDDGVDPRERHTSGPSHTKTHRKARQLCWQVAEALDQALATQADDLLRDLHVLDVEPAPDTARLLVTVTSLAPEPLDPAQVLAHLDRASSRLRCDVAAAITRRRAPQLSFRLAISTGIAVSERSL
jgi:ribosome-binding factor A